MQLVKVNMMNPLIAPFFYLLAVCTPFLEQLISSQPYSQSMHFIKRGFLKITVLESFNTILGDDCL